MITGSSGFKPNREGEALSRRAKNLFHWKSGVRKWFKRRFWKQMRWAARREARKWAEQLERYRW